jgi:ribonucleoside-triphosphate reductase
MDQLSAYCVGHDLKSLLIEGFTGVPGKVESAPAKHFRTALLQCCNFIYTLQGETAGAQAFSNFDTYLAPFIRYDGLSYEEVRQSMEEFIFNLNVPTRVGFQSPFSNITLDLTCPKFMKDEAVIIGGEPQAETYGQFQTEMDMFNKAFLEVMCKGDNRGRVFTFPIPTYNITSDFNWGSDITNLIMESSARYGIPTFSNYVNSDLNPDDVRSMCCRLRIDNTKLRRGGSQFGSAPLTGSIGVVTLNLPRMAHEARSIDVFLTKLKNAIETAASSLEIKREFVERHTEGGLYPYSAHYMKDIKARTGKYWANHFSTIGIIGMAEAIEELGQDISTANGKQMALDIMKFIEDGLTTIQKATGNLYNLEATPAEGTTHKLAMADRKEHPTIKTQGDVATAYYTNSTHLPHNPELSLFDILDHQDDLQCAYTGGTTLPIYIGQQVTNAKAIGELVKTICENYKLPYFSIIPTFSVCPSHGYIRGEHYSCPACGTETEVYSKVVGFIRPIASWNRGKRREFLDRCYDNLITPLQ